MLFHPNIPIDVKSTNSIEEIGKLKKEGIKFPDTRKLSKEMNYILETFLSYNEDLRPNINNAIEMYEYQHLLYNGEIDFITEKFENE